MVSSIREPARPRVNATGVGRGNTRAKAPKPLDNAVRCRHRETVGSTNTVCSVGHSLEVQHDACASPRNAGFPVSRNRWCERPPAIVKRASAAFRESSISDPRLGSFRAGKPRRRRFAVRRWRAAQQPHKTGVVSRAHLSPAVAAASRASRNTYLTGTHTAAARKHTPAPSWNWCNSRPPSTPTGARRRAGVLPCRCLVRRRSCAT